MTRINTISNLNWQQAIILVQELRRRGSVDGQEWEDLTDFLVHTEFDERSFLAGEEVAMFIRDLAPESVKERVVREALQQEEWGPYWSMIVLAEDHPEWLTAVEKASRSSIYLVRCKGRFADGLSKQSSHPVVRKRKLATSKNLERDLVQIFKLLADETRLKILMYLMREGELSVSALCDRFGLSQPAVSHHLALLRVAGMIEPRRDGKNSIYTIQKDHFHKIMGELFSNLMNDRKMVDFSDFLVTQQK